MKLSIRNFVTSIGVILIAAMNCSAVPEIKIDVSKIVDKATVESILGAKVQYPTPVNIQGSEGYYSKCNYYSIPPGKTLLLRLYQASERHETEQELNGMMKNTPGLKPVSGLGDKAFASEGVASALPSDALMLYVVKGKSILTVGLSGYSNDAGSLEKAKEVAQKILPHL